MIPVALSTAGGDSDASVVDFYTAFADRAEPRHLALFARTIGDLDAFLREQDLVYADDGAALVYHGTDLHEAVGQVAGAGAFRVEAVDGQIREAALPVRELGS